MLLDKPFHYNLCSLIWFTVSDRLRPLLGKINLNQLLAIQFDCFMIPSCHFVVLFYVIYLVSVNDLLFIILLVPR